MKYTKKLPRLIFTLCLLFFTLFIAQRAEAHRETPENPGGSVWLIPIHGDIMPSLAVFVRREARNAVNNGAEFIIFEIDTFGGRVDSALQITSFISSLTNIKTVAWVNNSETSMGVSWSAGALIAFACSKIYMAPGTSMGAAAPVAAGPDGSTVSVGEKTVAAVRSQMAALAERNGHPVGLALAMVDYDIELWEVIADGKTMAFTLSELERLERDNRDGSSEIERIGIISTSGKLLSLSAGEADRYGLLAGIADSREELLEFLGATGEITESVPGAADSVISFITSQGVQALLILLALVMLFLEFQSPGFGIPGTIALVCFLVVFGAGALLGRVGSLEIILLLAGLGLLAVEIFATPGFGVLGIVGILIVVFSLVLTMQDFVFPRLDWEWTIFGRNILTVILILLSGGAIIAFMSLFGRKVKMFDRLALNTSITGTAGGPDPDSPEFNIDKAGSAAPEYEENYTLLLGKTGITESVLRTSGKAVIDKKSYAVETDGEFIEPGINVMVTRVRGNRITVKRN